MCKPVATLTIATSGEYTLNMSWVDLVTGAKKKQKFACADRAAAGSELFGRALAIVNARPTSASSEAQKKVAALQAVLDLKLWGDDDTVKAAIQAAADKLRATF